MTHKFTLAAAALTATALPAFAEGTLNIFNFGLYTPPDLIEKFEKTYDVDVTVTEFDTNETALAKIEAGGHGFDIVLVSASIMPVYLEKNLLLKSEPGKMENFKHVSEPWANVPWDPERAYTAPWVEGYTGVMVNRDVYDGDIDTSAIFLDPPEELKGTINVMPQMAEVMDLAIMYVGGEPCTSDKDILRAAQDKLLEAKPDWVSIDYVSFEKLINEDVQATVFWNGASIRIRAENDGFEFGYPKEGFLKWQDNIAILADARNVENAKLFQNFIMDPENAALVSNYTGYTNGITGSEEFMDAALLAAPELNLPDEFADKAVFQTSCSPEVQDLYSRIWTNVTK